METISSHKAKILLLVCLLIALTLGLTRPLSVQAWDPSPHTGSGNCSVCHQPHTGGGAGIVDRSNSFCLTCHNGVNAPVASTHGSPSGGAEAGFELLCIQCHNPHVNGTTNLALIQTQVVVDVLTKVTTGPIVFTSTTGIGSFDDGASAQTSRICVACHVNSNNPGFPMANHTGGANHMGGDSYVGENCTDCHPHSADNDPATVDGFMPSGGSCLGCHKQARGSRRQIVDSNGDGTGTGGDFLQTSHHVSGTSIPTAEDCQVCHEMSQHRQGKVRLYNEDDPGIVYTDASVAADYESFCLSCHDGNGALRLATPTTPFSGTGTPSEISPALWNASSHNGSAAAGSCKDCHSNGHGSSKDTLLSSAQSPYNYANDGNADDPLKQQERFCFDCHDGTEATSNTQAEFGLGSHHIVQASQQSAYGIQLECVNCHNPHTNTRTAPLSNPDNRSATAAPVVDDSAFCLACHDNTAVSPLPAGVSFGNFDTVVKGFKSGAGTVTIWDKSKIVGTVHNTNPGDGNVNFQTIPCRYCHENHGSGVNGYAGATPAQTTRDLLKANYSRREGFSGTASPNGYWAAATTSPFYLCFYCHRATNTQGTPNVQSSSFGGYHNKHSQTGNANNPCIGCHDPHSPHDASEFGLNNFEYARQFIHLNTAGTQLLTYSPNGTGTASTAFVIGTPRSYCYISCHSTTHSSSTKTFNHTNVDTTPNTITPLFQFIDSNSPSYTLETLSGTFEGAVSNPDTALQGNGYFNGNGVDTFINFTNDPASFLAKNALTIETRVKPEGIPSVMAAPALTAASYESVIFDRGAKANYRVSIVQSDLPGVASFAFWANTINKHGGKPWKLAITNANACPIVPDHWYTVKVQWNSTMPKGPVEFFVDDQGPNGDNVDQSWAGVKKCTERRLDKIPLNMRFYRLDRIKSQQSNFVIGARAEGFGAPFQGQIDYLMVSENAPLKAQLSDWLADPLGIFLP